MFQYSERYTHPRATVINSSPLSGPMQISGTSQQQLVPNWDKPTLDSALKKGKESLLLLLSLLYQSGLSAPLPLVATFIAGAY